MGQTANRMFLHSPADEDVRSGSGLTITECVCGARSPTKKSTDLSGLDSFPTPQFPGMFYTCFHNHAHRPRLEKMLSLELSTVYRRSPNGLCKPLLDPGDRSASETAARRLQERNGRCATVLEPKRSRTNL